ncbi:ABC transporter permease [Metallumcola ferriviriculae]|uniref:ABC transporter permease n=1 Tax=Metallumcola ferriviriculae TaxID=3039180 RepID=A0AAU0UH42_9FIRM|nr:ABC transporter permease [Desulfitibacteraceae bacterium MK1]
MDSNSVAADTNGEIRTSRPRFYMAKSMGKKLLKDKLVLTALAFITVVILTSVMAPIFSPFDPGQGTIWERLTPPVWLEGGSSQHLLGTDQQGRDVLSRLMWGGRVSLRVGFLVMLVSGTVGTILGLTAGYFGGRIDGLIMRLVDIQFCFPGMLIALVFVMVLGPGEFNLVLALAFNGWMVYARMARGLVLSLRDGPLVEAAKAIGTPPGKIMYRHIFPNIFSPLLTLYVLEVARIILAEATMSFLGYGIQPPKASWGLIIGEGRKYITAGGWWLVVFPGVLIALSVLSLNIISGWMRTELDPLQRGKSLR